MLNPTRCPQSTDLLFSHLSLTWLQAKWSIRTRDAKLLIPIDLDESPARRKSDSVPTWKWEKKCQVEWSHHSLSALLGSDQWCAGPGLYQLERDDL